MDHINTLIFLDLEFTQSKVEDAYVTEIIQIGAVKTDAKLNELSRFNTYVKPYHEPILSYYSKKVTDIDQEDIDQAKLFHEVLPLFEEWIGDFKQMKIICWSNSDFLVMKQEILRHATSKKLMDEELYYNFQVNFVFNNNQLSLTNAVSLYNLDWIGRAHDALGDALNLKELYVAYTNNKDLFKVKTFETEVHNFLSLLENKLNDKKLVNELKTMIEGYMNLHHSVEDIELVLKYLFRNAERIDTAIYNAFNNEWNSISNVYRKNPKSKYMLRKQRKLVKQYKYFTRFDKQFYNGMALVKTKNKLKSCKSKFNQNENDDKALSV